jgi:hypothetical protein
MSELCRACTQTNGEGLYQCGGCSRADNALLLQQDHILGTPGHENDALTLSASDDLTTATLTDTEKDAVVASVTHGVLFVANDDLRK